MTKIIQESGEHPLELQSEITGPIKSLSLLRRSMQFAELAMISYNDPFEAGVAARAISFPETDFFDNDGSQADKFREGFESEIACLGTEPSLWNAIQADANSIADVAETVGPVHRGFKKEVDGVWPQSKVALRDNKLPL